MGLKNYTGQGPNWVGAYQVSGVPYVTSSAAGAANGTQVTRVRFPYVTKNVMIKNTGDYGLRVAFSLSGSFGPSETIPGGTTTTWKHRNYFVIPPDIDGTQEASSIPATTFDVRCKDIYLRSNDASNSTTFSLYAGLTGIEYDQFPILSASNGFLGVG